MIDVTAPALFSPCRRYRHWLRRDFAADGLGNFWSTAVARRPSCIWTFIGYNPSVADVSADDPTVRRMIGFAQAGGATSLIVTNIMTAVHPDPDALAALDDPVGPMADWAILAAATLATASGGCVVAAWGVPKGRGPTKDIAVGRMAHVRHLLRDHPVCVLRMTASGFPQHPLYLPKTLEPKLWG